MGSRSSANVSHVTRSQGQTRNRGFLGRFSSQIDCNQDCRMDGKLVISSAEEMPRIWLLHLVLDHMVPSHLLESRRSSYGFFVYLGQVRATVTCFRFSSNEQTTAFLPRPSDRLFVPRNQSTIARFGAVECKMIQGKRDSQFLETELDTDNGWWILRKGKNLQLPPFLAQIFKKKFRVSENQGFSADIFAAGV